MRTRKGFTIVELVIVIAVIAVLAAVLIPSFSGVVEKADKNTALKLAESAYKEARAAEIEKGGSFPRASDEVDGFVFEITADGSGDRIFRYPTDNSFEYEIRIENKKVSLGGKLVPPNPEGNYANDTPAAGVALHRDRITLEVGQTELLHAAVQPANAKPTVVEWEYDNNGVIEFSNGQIVAKAQGDAKIRAKIKNEAGNYVFSDYCTVTVERVKVNFVSLNALNMSFTLGDVGRQLTATVKPSTVTAPYDTVRWNSANERIATVDENTGFVTPKGPGYTEITATVDGKTAKCGITVNGFVLDDATMELEKGNIFNVPFTVYPANSEIRWESGDGDVATVSNGLVTAVGAGTTTITATTMGITKTLTVVVTGEEPTVTEMTLDRTSAYVKKGETITLTATAPNGSVITWTSDNSKVSIVSSNDACCVLEGVETGTAKITATAKNGENNVGEASCEVTVYESEQNPSYTVTINAESTSIIDGGTTTLTATVENPPADHTVEWTSSNSAVATVDSEGNITAVKPGTATITAAVKVIEAVDETSVEKIVAFATCDITVNPITVTVEIDSPHAAFSGATTVDRNSDYTGILIAVEGYEIENIEVNNGNETFNVTYDLENHNFTVPADKVIGGENILIKIKTKSVEQTIIPAEWVELDKTEISLERGNSETLNETIYPRIATDQSVTWTSSNPGVASVNSSGVVTAHKNGEATITVTTSNGLTATCIVTVTSAGEPVTGITLDNEVLSLSVGESGQLTATVNPSDAGNKNIIWGSLNSAVATVDSTGKVTAKAAGTAIITVTTIEGNFSAMCTVTVTDPQPPADPEPTESHSVSGSGEHVEIWVNETDITKESCTIGDGGTLSARVQPEEGFVITGVRIERNATEVTDGYAINYAGGDIEIVNVTCLINITVETAPNMATSATTITNDIIAELDISSIADTGDNNTVYIWSKKNTIDHIIWTITKGEGTETGVFEDIKSSSYSFIVDADKIQGLTGLYLTIHCTGGDNVGSISKDDFVITYKPPMGLFNE